ncbi:MAG: hypothetical protein JNM09_12650 [Blastocatellia bacterium]|nr:hypothetical protein [Blastocatellia bacterium]
MTKQPEPITVHCPQCAVVITGVTAETMVYCITCRKWCREVEASAQSAAIAATPAPRPRRRYRCH